VVIIPGYVIPGCGDFQRRLLNEKFCVAFRKATGEDLVKGTLNVEVNRCIPVNEHFRILNKDLDENPPQDLLFEICRIGRNWVYRIRPYNLCTGAGGHGDHIIEIGCSEEIPNATEGSPIEITMFRNDLI
jgi:hypothetical protein